jgi:hypothetical protein
MKQKIAFFRAQGLTASDALKYAKAEDWAEDQGIEAYWEHDEEPDLSLMDEDERANVKEVLCCRLIDNSEEHYDISQLSPRQISSLTLAGPLCGIIDPSRAYARIVAAELALEIKS